MVWSLLSNALASLCHAAQGPCCCSDGSALMALPHFSRRPGRWPPTRRSPPRGPRCAGPLPEAAHRRRTTGHGAENRSIGGGDAGARYPGVDHDPWHGIPAAPAPPPRLALAGADCPPPTPPCSCKRSAPQCQSASDMCVQSLGLSQRVTCWLSLC